MSERLPQDVIDAFLVGTTPAEGWRELEAEETEHDYRQHQANLILDRMVPESEDLTTEQLLDILHIYYWWNDNTVEIQHGITNVLLDANEQQFTKIANALHTMLPELCQTDTDMQEGGCKNTIGMQCLVEYAEIHGIELTTILTDRQDRLGLVFQWLDGIDSTSEEMPYEITLPDLLEQLHSHAKDRLLAAGATDIEAGHAPMVLDKESDRRFESHIAYTSLRQRGISPELILNEYWPKALANDVAYFNMIARHYEIPNDLIWDDHKMVALARRYLQEHPELLQHQEDSYKFEVLGLIPDYVIKFSEDAWNGIK